MTEIDDLCDEPAQYSKPICPTCRGDQILRDAWAEWSPSKGEWVLQATFDNFWCESCESELKCPEWVELEKPLIIQMQNDQFRSGEGQVPGRQMVTIGIQDLVVSAGKRLQDVFDLVAKFNTFTEDNDPRQEHDFGSFDFEDQRCFWKIDYYCTDLDGGSDDPSDLTKTQRVLTIMLAQEY